ncbi:MAG: hypothetical protein A3F67_09325 [Verrucomicrobia bacterium RIFCSPHIGHO2_12_FULL_41_10]|nr:MAG: hypothetical protein A3F67_09325 [Verrucomicrobia bacterium RIFCSPHIGHO2_12_FULL_41_10]HLB34113.1 hypothetical protein [Chthoniobacterales bacterium]
MKKNHALCLMLPLALIAFGKIQAEDRLEEGITSQQSEKNQLPCQNGTFTDNSKGIEPHLTMRPFSDLLKAELEDALKPVVRASQQDQINHLPVAHVPTEETRLYPSTTFLTDESRVLKYSMVIR